MSESATPFLTARWSDLVLVTYRIDADMLSAHLPPGLEPDRREGDPAGVAYASLVAFRFLHTKVKGLSVPLHTDFPEVNLRGYVRQRVPPHRRGVIFIAELVPKLAITAVANILYHEHYRTVPMTIGVSNEGDRRRLVCEIETGERHHRIVAWGRRPAVRPAADSAEHFFKEHEWGFGRDLEGDSVIYRVEHPVWDVYPCSLDDVTVDVDFGELYGQPWDRLDALTPAHVAFAVGSEIAVYPRGS